MLPAQPNQSLIDGLACLQAIAARGGSVGVRELGRELDIEPTKVSRLLGTLAHLGFAERDTERRYRPGPAMHVLSAQSLIASRLLAHALPVLLTLRDENLSVVLGVLWRNQVCYLYYLKPGQSFTEGMFHFNLFPADNSSLGLVLLAAQPRREVAGVKLTPVLRERLREVAAAGYCEIDRDGNERSLAVPVGKTPIAAIAFAGKYPAAASLRLRERLLAAAREITEKL